MKRIGLVSGDVSGGVTYQRAHIPFQRLDRSQYEIRPFHYHEMEHKDGYYLDALVVVHPWAADHLRFIERAKGYYKIPVVVDIDDLLNNLPSDHPEFALISSNQLVDRICAAADHLVVSTEYLKKAFGHYNSKITVIENSIDDRRFEGFNNALKPYHSGFVVGWTGGQSHRSDQFQFLGALERFMDAHEDVRASFHVLCPQRLLDRFGSRILFEPQPVDHMDYVAMCATYPYDVCLVGLAPHPFNDGKSDLRLLDMAPFGIPIIASPRADFRRHHMRAFIVQDDTEEAWLNELELAYSRADLRKMYAENAKDYVFNLRNAGLAAEKWHEVLQGVVT